MIYREIVGKVADELGVPKMLVHNVYQAYWRCIREYVTSLPLKQDLSDEQFQELRPNINLPYLGKLCVTLDRYRKLKKKQREKELIKNKQDAAH